MPIRWPGGSRSPSVRLAEKRAQLKRGPEVRQIRRLLDNGRQMPLVPSHFRMSMERVAGAQFSRWSRESFFEYLREEFNLDALAAHGLEMQDPEARVVNPRWHALDRNIQRLRQRLATLRIEIADLTRGAPSTAAARKLQAGSDALDARREALKLQRSDTPRYVTVADLDQLDALDALPEGEKLLLDIIRMIACRAETRVMPAVAQAQGKDQRSRRHLRALVQTAADIIPEPDNGILRVRILGTASDASDNATAALLEELKQTRTVFPGASLRMVYERPQNGADPVPSGAGK